jgi:hypothetical protein
VAAEGWFKDPFAVHEDRWFSAGSPTDLVKDGSSEMSDPPPDRPISGGLEPAAPNAVPGPFSESSFPEGVMNPGVIFRASNARGCFSILGLWILSAATAPLVWLGASNNGWGLVAIGIEAAVVVLLSIILYRRRGRDVPFGSL